MHPQEFKLTYSVEIFDHLCTVKSSMEYWMANCSKIEVGTGWEEISNKRRERAVWTIVPDSLAPKSIYSLLLKWICIENLLTVLNMCTSIPSTL